MPKQGKVKLKYHTNAAQVTQNKQSYINYSVQQDGSISAARSTLKLTVSDKKEKSDPSLNEAAVNANPVEDALSDVDEAIDKAYLEHVEETTLDDKDKARRVRPKGDESLRQWEPLCDMFLAELIQLEGRGCWSSNQCVGCGQGEAAYECRDCGIRELICDGCMVKRHASLYLHRIQRWNGLYFERTSLKELGLRVQLGHSPGQKCLNPERCTDDDFCIVDVNGIHNVGIDFCACGQSAQQHTVQLLRQRLYPATVTAPKSAATQTCLEAFEVLSYESKITAFEYYQSLTRLTNNTQVNPPKDRYLAFLRMTHEWRHLKMLKRSGRGHDSERSVNQTLPGECAVLCPACPQPEKNMAPGWENEPPERQYLHALFIALDANFRLKRKKVSSDEADPGLSKGFAYVVEEGAYKKHLDRYKEEKEPKSTCSRHDAVNLSNSDRGPGHAASGVGTVDCSRHDMKRPCGVGDLQLGERYCNMDYLFYSTMHHSRVKCYVVSYDIACQWSINLGDRMARIDEFFWVFSTSDVNLVFLVPKFHLPAHILKCRTLFSFNYCPGVGRSDGEAPERGWAKVNPLAPSTREMGPGSRRDTLDYHFGDSNWQKTTGLGILLRRRMLAAASEMAEHRIGHQELEKTIPAETIALWTEEITAWEKDKGQQNPYEMTTEGPTIASIRRELAEEEAQDLQAGRDFTLDKNMSPALLISAGLDLEAEQRAVKVLSKELWDHSQDRQKTALQLRNNALMRKINAWTPYLTLYVPSVSLLRSRFEEDLNTDVRPHDLPLWLPSQILGQATVDRRLCRIEWRNRYAQAHEALARLRQHLQVRAYLYNFKDRFVRGQGANTRARNTIDTVTSKIKAAADEYRAAYTALQALAPSLSETDWTRDLLPLREVDIRDLSEGKLGESEGRRTISWIWKSIPSEQSITDPGFLHERIRVEWCQSRARASRFTEEVELLKEEMARVLRFFIWKATDWREKGKTTALRQTSVTAAEAYKGYAERQAALYDSLRCHFEQLWAPLPSHVARMQSLIDQPSSLGSITFDKKKPRGRPPKIA